MEFKTLHEDWKTLVPGPFTEPEDDAIYKEFLKIKEQGDVHHHHYAKGDNPDDKKKREKDAKSKAKEGEAKADKSDSNDEAKPKEGEAKASGNGEEKKKLDPVGKEDGDIDNDGDQDKSDKYLAKKRKAIGKSIKAQKKTKVEKPIKLSGEKEKVNLHKGVEEASTFTDKVRDAEKKKKRHFAFGGKGDDKRWGKGGYRRGSRSNDEEVEVEEGHEKEIANFMDKAFQGVDYHFKQGALHVAKGFRGKVARRMAGEGIKPPIKGITEEGLDEISKELKVRAYTKAGEKALSAQARRVKGDLSAGKEVLKRTDQRSKFYRAIFDKKNKKEEVEKEESEWAKSKRSDKEMEDKYEKIHQERDKRYKAQRKKQEKKEGVEFDSKGKIKSLGFSFSDKVKKYNKKMQKSKDEMKKYKKEDTEINELSPELMRRAWQGATKRAAMAGRADRGDEKAAADHAKRRKQSSKFFNKYIKTQEDTEVDEMSAIQKTALNIHNQRVKLGIVKPGTKKSKESGVQKAAKHAGMSSAERSYLYNDSSVVDEAPSDYENEIKKFKAGGGKVKKLKPGKKFGSLFKQKGPKRPPRHEETEVEEGTGLQVKMALDDAGVKGNFKDGKVSVHKKHVKKAHKALKGNVYYKGKTPDVVGEEVELDEAAVRGKLRDLSQELAAYARKHRSSVDKQYFEKIAQIAAAGKMPSAKDIDTDTEPRDFVLDMMAKSFPLGIMKNYKGVSPALDHALRKDPMKQDKSLEQKRNKSGLFYARHGEEVELDYNNVDEMSKELLYKAAKKAEVQGREPAQPTSSDRSGTGFGKRDPNIRRKRRAQAVKFVKGMIKAKEEVNTGNNRLGALEKEIDKLHGRTKHMKYLKGKDRDQMRDLSRKRDKLLKSRSIQGKFEEVELDELVAPGKKSASGYILYHKTFSDAMQHAVDHAKTKGATVDPKEIDDKVATGPRKPSSGKTNRYSLQAGRKRVEIQVANLDNKAYELNMYIEGVQLGEEFKSRISNNPVVNKLYLMNQAKAIGKERKGPDKEHKISAWEDLAKKMGFNRRDYEEFGDNQGMYESSIPQQKGDMATKTRLKLEKVLQNRKNPIEPKESERAGEEGTDKLSDNYKEATPGQGDVKEGNVIVNDRDPYRVFEHMVHYLMGTSIKNIEDYTFYRIDETPHNLRLENKEGALATITLTDVQSFYDDQDMDMDEFIEMMEGFGVKELTEKGNSIIGDEGVPAIGKDKTGQGIYTTDPPKTFENIDLYSKYIQSNEERRKKGFVVN